MTNYSHRTIGGVEIVALNRHGGASTGAFDSLNLAAYVGDDPANVTANIQIAARQVQTKNVAVLRADHGNVVHTIGDISGVHELPVGDGAVTTQPGVALLALAADCVAGAIVDPIHRVIGIFHAGWKGVLSHVVDATWQKMCDQGAQRASAHAVLGPSICGKCYEVEASRVNQFRDVQPECVVDDRHLDVSAGIRAQLVSLGIPTEVIPGCTFEDDRLFSYRRAHGEPTGRGGLIVCMQERAT